MTFGKKIKKYRESKGWSQEQLAKELNTSKQVISRYENEQRSPKIDVAIEYAKILNIPIPNLIDDTVDIFDTQKKAAPSQKRDKVAEKIKSLSEDEQSKALDFINYLIQSRGRNDM